MPDYEAFPTLRVERPEDAILRIVLDGPDVDAVGPDAHGRLADIWPVLDRDDSVRAVVVQGAGRGFSAAGSLDLVELMVTDPAVRTRVLREARDLVHNVVNFSKPVVSAIHGPCVGAGLAVALLADVSVAARTAKIVDDRTPLAVVAGDQAMLSWPLLCGTAKAPSLQSDPVYLLTCDALTGEEAERIGLVSRCVDDDQVHDRAMEVAWQLVAGSPSAIAFAKQALHDWYRTAGPYLDASLEFHRFGILGSAEPLLSSDDR